MFFDGPLPRVDLRLDAQGNPDLALVGDRHLEMAELCIRALDAEQPKKNIKRQPPRRSRKSANHVRQVQAAKNK